MVRPNGAGRDGRLFRESLKAFKRHFEDQLKNYLKKHFPVASLDVIQAA